MSSVSDPLRGRERSRQVGRRRRSPPPLRRSTRSRHLLPPGRELDTYAYPIESVITDPTTTHWPLGYPPYIGYPLQPYGGYMVPGFGIPNIPAGGYPDLNGGPEEGGGTPDHDHFTGGPPGGGGPLKEEALQKEVAPLEEEPPWRHWRSRRTPQ